MTLYQKTLLIVSSTVLGLTLATYALVSFIIVNHYTQLETQLVRQQVEQAKVMWQQEGNCTDLGYTFASWTPHRERNEALAIKVYQVNDPQLPPDVRTAQRALSQQTAIFVQPLNQQTIAGYTLMPNRYNEPDFLLRVDSSRTIYQQGQNELIYLLVSLLTVGFASSMLMVTALNRQLLVPLKNLSEEVRRVGQSDDLSARVVVTGEAELAQLSRTVNGILAGKAHLFMRVDTQRKVMRRLSRQLISAQEEERRHLSRELHDGFGQMLMAIKLNLDMARRGAPPQNKLHHYLNEASGLATQVQEMARNLSLELHPAILEDLGLIAALHCELDRYEQRTGQILHFTTNLTETELPSEINITIYRVIIEALTNVARHAEAYQVWVRLNLQDNHIHLQIEDDGLGFEIQPPPNAPRHRKSLGLVSIKERVELLDGQFELISHLHVGTLITIALPLSV